MEEKELIHKVQQGNMNAFEQLFELYKDRAMRTAYLITGNKHTSEDIVQEAFVKCYLSIGSLKDPSHFKAWFFKLLTRLAWKASTKDRSMTPIENIYDQVEQCTDYSLQPSMEQALEAKELVGQIEKLPQKHQTILILYYYNDLSIKEIAKVVGCFEGTVKSRLHAAREKLRKEMSKESGILLKKEREYEENGYYKILG